MMPEEVRTEVYENKKVPFYKLESESSIKNFMDSLQQIKYFKIYTVKPGNFVIIVKMPWYYIWPLGYFYRKDVQRQITLLKSKHVTITVQKSLV